MAGPLFRCSTLRLHRPFGRGLLGALLALLALILLSEGALRMEPVNRHLLPPTFTQTVYYSELDVKLWRLERFGQTHTPNCFFMGSSVVDAGLDPDLFAAELERLTGQSLTCFNFGVSGMNPQGNSVLADILMAQYRPALLIYGTTAADYKATQSLARQLWDDHWVQFRRDYFSPQGWLLEYSYDYRYLLSMAKLQDGTYREDLVEWNRAVAADGLRRSSARAGVSQKPQTVLLKDYRPDANDLDGLRHILSWRRSGVKMILVEMPVNASFLPYYVEDGLDGYRQRFLAPLQTLAQEEDTPLIQGMALSTHIPAQRWEDRLHLNLEGVDQFTRWLAGQVGALYQSGQAP